MAEACIKRYDEINDGVLHSDEATKLVQDIAHATKLIIAENITTQGVDTHRCEIDEEELKKTIFKSVDTDGTNTLSTNELAEYFF